ncbi:MAG TPA: molybdopterin cofactor-binding domain-containing protein [Acetobacteraceae bacterium]|nr:molybdopterin cofactor-binding domain-containing protein [Acetobacteraceae bacterium]
MTTLSRRALLSGSGALIVSVSLRSQAQTLPPAPPDTAILPGSLQQAPYLDAWIRIDGSGAITVFTGKAELGQGIKTALLQIAAEELSVRVDHPSLVTADTALTANEGYTAGSHSLQDSGTAIRFAAAQVRQVLLNEAATIFQQPAGQLHLDDGAVVAPDGRRLNYGALVPPGILHVVAQPETQLKAPGAYTVVSTNVPRVDIPAKATGGQAFVQDMRLPGMLHARVVRPPHPGARLAALDTSAVAVMPGVTQVVQDGSFVAVVARQEFQAIKAMRALEAGARWQAAAGTLPPQADIFAHLASLPAQDISVLNRGTPPSGTAKMLSARYTRPYQMHGSIGPSCAVAQLRDGMMTIWTHSQGVYPDRAAIAELLNMPPAQVHCIHVEGSGCYGHNGADDAAADAALIARAMPGQPVRLQWMREQENGWEPLGPAMVSQVHASLDGHGHIVDWNYAVWSNTHSTRPGNAGSLLAGRLLAQPFEPPSPRPIPLPEGGGDRNSIPGYDLPSARVVYHFIPQMPLRVSAMRALGGYMNVFSIESFMDELASAAGADPVAFRLAHLDDDRAKAVVKRAAEGFGWGAKPPAGHGYGFGFARYKNLAAYCAVAAELAVEHETGRTRLVRAVAAVDAGQVVNPDGLRNQVEGAILQSTSWTLYESATFDASGVTSLDWASYPIMRFDAVPDSVEVHVIDRPGMPFLGAGECGQGPAAAAVANAVAHATGQRLRDLPLTRQKVKAAIGI